MSAEIPTASSVASQTSLPSPEGNPYTVDTEYVYHGMLPNDERQTNPIDLLVELRDGIETLPETKSVFKLTDLVDNNPNNTVKETMHELCGAWPVSRRGYRGNVYANPNSPDRWIYSDCFPTCECGATVTMVGLQGTGNSTDSIPARTEHDEDCPAIWQWRAKMQLAENRREEIIRQLHLDTDSRDLSRRIGLPGRQSVVGQYDVDFEHHRAIGEKMLAHTAVANLHLRPQRKVAKALGFSHPRLTRIIGEHFPEDVDYGYLFDVRRENGSANLGAMNTSDSDSDSP